MGGALIILAIVTIIWLVRRQWRRALEQIRREASVYLIGTQYREKCVFRDKAPNLSYSGSGDQRQQKRCFRRQDDKSFQPSNMNTTTIFTNEQQ